MKPIIQKWLLTVTAAICIQHKIDAQVINWEATSQQDRNLVHVNIGAEYGLVAGGGYHRLLAMKSNPVWVGGEFTLPSGNQLKDDFKARLGAQIRVFSVKKFQFSARVQAIARRYHNQSVRLFNIGTELAGTFGYYRKKWFAGIESGFDKAIVINFKHSKWFKENIYAKVQDGWYEPATGGNFYYGLQGSYSLKKADITIKAGRMLQQDFTSQPLIPFYGQLGVNFRF